MKTMLIQCVILLVALGIIKFPLVYSTHLDVNLNCSVNTFCSISENGETLELIISSSCGACTLRVNASQPYGVHINIVSLTSQSQFNHFYVTYGGDTVAFISPPDPCSISIPRNEIFIQFQMNARLVIQAELLSNNSQCSNSSMPCNVTTNCDSLLKFENVWKVTYEETETVFVSDYVHPNIYRWYGELEFKGELSECPSNCVCYLHYRQVIAQCGNATSQTLLIHPHPLSVSSAHYTFLDASNREIERIDLRAFDGLVYVNRLNLNQNLLTHIEPGTFSWNQLYMLELADNKLTNLASNLFNGLVFLFFIDLHGNQLTTLHSDLFKQQRFSLAAIELSRNNLNQISADTFKPLSNLRVLILDKNNLTTLQPGIFQTLKSLWWLYLDDNHLETISPDTFIGLKTLFRLHISGNQLNFLKPDMFNGIETLKELVISRNNIDIIEPGLFQHMPDLLLLALESNTLSKLDLQPFANLHRLVGLQISGNRLSSLEHGLSKSESKDSTNVTSLFPKLKIIQLNDNKIKRIDDRVFTEMPMIEAIEIRGNPLSRVDKTTFKTLESNNTYVLVDEPATCCFITTAQCKAKNPREPYLTCLRLLPYPSIRAFMWIFGLFAFVGNLSVLLWRCVKHGRENIIQVLLIENLATSDLLMGVYMLIIASADAYYRQYFPSESDGWRNGPVCKFAGTLSVLSSEASVFFITLISIDRFLAIKYPRGKQRLTKKSATISLACLWSLAFLLSIIPTSVSGLNSDFYDVSEVCIGLPFVRSPIFRNKTVVALDFDFGDYNSISSAKDGTFEEEYIYPETGNSPGLYFSIILFLGINFLCFCTVAVCYIFIFILYKQAAGKIGKSRLNEELALAIRMGAIVLTDFMCWVPIVIIGILVQSAVVTISPVVYVYIVVFILPINSAVNPYIYTIATIISDHRQKSKASQTKKEKEDLKGKGTVSKSTSVPSTSGSSSNQPNTSETYT